MIKANKCTLREHVLFPFFISAIDELKDMKGALI